MRLETRRFTWPIEPRGAARERTERTAILVALHVDGVIGLGEAAPLPGVSRETIDDVEHALAAAGADLPPSAQFALETAQLDAQALGRGVSIHELLGGTASRVPLAAVVDSVAEARAAWERGIRTLKLKLRASELGLAGAIVDALPGVRLRIDANRSWPRDRVRALLAALPQAAIEYVEEPCPDTIALLAESLPVPLALDESLVDDPRARAMLAEPVAPRFADPRRPVLLVLKPTLLGLGRCMSIARAAPAAILTHALEGPIGTAACAELALAIGGEHAVGLAPHPALAGFAVPQLRAAYVERAPYPGLGFSPEQREELWNRG